MTTQAQQVIEVFSGSGAIAVGMAIGAILYFVLGVLLLVHLLMHQNKGG
jgi:hypothetical protein